jgi:hypothetical protein
MTFAIFTRSNMVVNPGWLQIADTALVLISTLGITFAMFGRYHVNATIDVVLRCLLAAVSFVAMFHPDMSVSAAVAVVVALALFAGMWRYSAIAPRKTTAPGTLGGAARGPDELAPILAEAKRELG